MQPARNIIARRKAKEDAYRQVMVSRKNKISKCQCEFFEVDGINVRVGDVFCKLHNPNARPKRQPYWTDEQP